MNFVSVATCKGCANVRGFLLLTEELTRGILAWEWPVPQSGPVSMPVL